MNTVTKRYSILVVEDSELYRDVVIHALKRMTTMQIDIIGEADNTEDALEYLKPPTPDLVLLDLQIPRAARQLNQKSTRYGIEVAQAFHKHSPTTHILVLSTFSHDKEHLIILHKALQSGVCGYYAKFDYGDRVSLMQAVAKAIRGEAVFSPTIAPLVDRLKELTVQEKRIFELIAQGDDNHMIANELNITFNTVKTHQGKLFDKLGIRHRDTLLPDDDPDFFTTDEIH